jgi:TIR domain
MNQPSPWPVQQHSQSAQKKLLPRTNGRILVKILLYFVGVAIAEVGVLGGALGASGSSTSLGCVAFSFSLLALIGSIAVFFRKKYYLHCLPGLQYLWWTLGVTAGSFIALGMVFGFTKPNTSQMASALAGGVLFFYGVSLMWVAHLKPPLAQQVNESVYRILQAMPGNQIAISDLLARLQGEYKQLGMTVHQHIGNLEYIEQVAIPGVPEIAYRLKQPKPSVAVPQTPPIPISTPYPQMASVPPQLFQVPIRQTLLPQTPRQNDVFRSLADQQTATALPVPNPITPVQPPVPNRQPQMGQTNAPQAATPQGTSAPPANQKATPVLPVPNPITPVQPLGPNILSLPSKPVESSVPPSKQFVTPFPSLSAHLQPPASAHPQPSPLAHLQPPASAHPQPSPSAHQQPLTSALPQPPTSPNAPSQKPGAGPLVKPGRKRRDKTSSTKSPQIFEKMVSSQKSDTDPLANPGRKRRNKGSSANSPQIFEQKPPYQGQRAIRIFCCYARKDEQRMRRLQDHLQPQQRQGIVHIWHDRDINAGAEWEKEIKEQLNAAQIILFLVSADFMASDYCYSKEMKRALERHRRGEVRAIPIILRPTDWEKTPLGKLQALPKNGRPITSWSYHDEGYLSAALGIRDVVEALLTTP